MKQCKVTEKLRMLYLLFGFSVKNAGRCKEWLEKCAYFPVRRILIVQKMLLFASFYLFNFDAFLLIGCKYVLFCFFMVDLFVYGLKSEIEKSSPVENLVRLIWLTERDFFVSCRWFTETRMSGIPRWGCRDYRDPGVGVTGMGVSE